MINKKYNNYRVYVLDVLVIFITIANLFYVLFNIDNNLQEALELLYKELVFINIFNFIKKLLFWNLSTHNYTICW